MRSLERHNMQVQHSENIAQNARTRTGKSTGSADRLPARRVLVMDDDATTRMILSLIIAQEGWRSVEAENGEEAIAAFKWARASGDPFDAVLLDLKIRGGMGGQETMQTLASIDPAVKAVVISGNTFEPAFARFREFGFRNALPKPFSGEALMDVLREVLTTSP